jgi:hypothetical protein
VSGKAGDTQDLAVLRVPDTFIRPSSGDAISANGEGLPGASHRTSKAGDEPHLLVTACPCRLRWRVGYWEDGRSAIAGGVVASGDFATKGGHVGGRLFAAARRIDSIVTLLSALSSSIPLEIRRQIAVRPRDKRRPASARGTASGSPSATGAGIGAGRAFNTA